MKIKHRFCGKIARHPNRHNKWLKRKLLPKGKRAFIRLEYRVVKRLAADPGYLDALQNPKPMPERVKPKILADHNLVPTIPHVGYTKESMRMPMR